MLPEISDSMTQAAKEIAKEQTFDLIALSLMRAMGLSNPRISSARTSPTIQRTLMGQADACSGHT
jgi:hypothetical protein